MVIRQETFRVTVPRVRVRRAGIWMRLFGVHWTVFCPHCLERSNTASFPTAIRVACLHARAHARVRS